MNQNQNKIFCGTGKSYGKYGAVGIMVFLDEIPDEHIFMVGDKKAVKLNVCPKKEPNDKTTHYIEVNTWKPEKKQNQQPGKNIPVDTSFDMPIGEEIVPF